MAALRIVIFDQRWKATFTNAQEALMKAALSRKYGYQVNIPNPSFNPSLPVSPENSPLMANPLSVEDFVAKAILQELVGAGKVNRLQEVQQTAIQAANTQVNTEFDAIDVAEDVV